MFAKQPNTIYEVRVVDQIYSKKVNIFFEWYKIGKATRSQQIAQFDSTYTEQIPEIIKKIRKERSVYFLNSYGFTTFQTRYKLQNVTDTLINLYK